MNVTQEIRNNHIRYGASDNTAAYGTSSSKSLNYAKGASITNPAHENVIAAPYNAHYKDDIGLFGAENYFIKFTIDLVYSSLIEEGEGEVDEDGYIPVTITGEPYNATTNPGCPLEEHPQPHSGGSCNPPFDSDGYDEVGWWKGLDIPENVAVNDYYPARITNDLVTLWDSMARIDLTNLKTGNKYVDAWVDVRLYTSQREEHPYDQMWVRYDDFFYLGVHARNTRRLPYDINCIIGSRLGRYSKFNAEDKAKTARGSQPHVQLIWGRQRINRSCQYRTT